jgi:hypothetical protein
MFHQRLHQLQLVKLIFVLPLLAIMISCGGGGGGGGGGGEDTQPWVGTWLLQTLDGQDYSNDNIRGVFTPFSGQEGHYDSDITLTIHDNSGKYIVYDYTILDSQIELFKSEYDSFSAWNTTTPGADNYLTMNYSIAGNNLQLSCESYVGEDDDFCATSVWIKENNPSDAKNNTVFEITDYKEGRGVAGSLCCYGMVVTLKNIGNAKAYRVWVVVDLYNDQNEWIGRMEGLIDNDGIGPGITNWGGSCAANGQWIDDHVECSNVSAETVAYSRGYITWSDEKVHSDFENRTTYTQEFSWEAEGEDDQSDGDSDDGDLGGVGGDAGDGADF